MTAYATGTATNAADFLSKLTSFLTANASLTGASPSQAWTQVWTANGDVVLKGPGLSNSDSVYVGMRLTQDNTNLKYVLYFNGMTGVLSNATAMEGHINVCPNVAMYLDNNPMTYWFIASGRRFIVVAQIGTIYESAYCGLFLPYGTPSQYPLPLFIGGSRGAAQLGNGVTDSWRSTDPFHTHFVSPYQNYTSNSTSANNIDAQAYTLDPSSQWLRGMNNSGGPLTEAGFMIGPETMGDGFGALQSGDLNQQGYNTFRTNMREAFGGQYALTPMTLLQEYPTDATFGILDGVYHVPGYNNASANTVTVGSTNHLVVQNVFRTGLGNLWALALG